MLNHTSKTQIEKLLEKEKKPHYQAGIENIGRSAIQWFIKMDFRRISQTFIIVTTGLILVFLFKNQFRTPVGQQLFIPLRVAHAGGAIDGTTYTNSYEALDENLKNGFQYFELDFSYTKDGKLVCLHDWQSSFQRSFGLESQGRVTFDEFKSLVANKATYTKCTLEGLALWLESNPSAYIITDIKEKNKQALSTIVNLLPNARKRVIPQIYQPENFHMIKKMGYEQVIWTVYLYQGNDEEILDWVDTFSGPFAITMPGHKAFTMLPRELKTRNIPTYAHTINKPHKLKKYIEELGITEIYTDFLAPD